VEDALLRPAEVPAVPLPEMRMMVKYSAKTYLQQELPDHTFDCFILPARPGSEGSRPGQKCKVLIGGAKNQFVNDLRAAARTAGLVLDFIAPNLIGPINALEMAQPEIFRTGAIAIVDLGFRNTTISILLNGELILQRVVNIGGDKLTTGLAEAMNIGYAEAEGIKIGLSEEVQPNLQALVSPIGRELRASLDYFEHQYDKPVSKVLLSGGSSRSEFILQTLQEELMVPCMTWDPTNFLQPSLPPERMGDFDQVSSQLTVAVGTAVAVF
jgi:Tfp pilus assembly PilM family ATPase